MHLSKKTFINKFFITTVLITFILLCNTTLVSAAKSYCQKDTKDSMQLEKLGRGLTAASTSEGVFLSWRLLGSEATGYSETGLTGVNFNVYKKTNGKSKKIATVKNSTNFIDKNAKENDKYYVRAVNKKGKETDKSDTVSPWENSYYDIPLQKPDDGITPAGEEYTYSANDMSVGDTDGDGEYEYFVKWYPSNSKDVSQKGYTGNIYIDCYKMDGRLLYRYDLGVNIRAGAHYTQFLVYDFDGDGISETMFKTAPGTKIIRYRKNGSIKSEKYITMPKSDIKKGYKNTDDYRMSAEDYYDHVVEMFMNWQNQEEVIAGNWPDNLEECFGIDKKYAYPLSKKNAQSLATYFIETYAPSRSTKNDLTTFEGFIVDGPEYLSVFDGKKGEELQTITYKPGRHDDGLMWGDYAMSRIEPANRVDRFLAGVAYLDGSQPYAIFARGYYTRSTVVSYSWNGKKLEEYWYIDSGWTPMSNPFNDSPHGVNGTDPKYGEFTTQGAHSLSTADVDNDGKDEIIYGSSTIDNDGNILYNSSGIMPDGKTEMRLGHGDSLHVADIDPENEGLEIFMCFEGGTYAPYGYALRDGKTGEVLFGEYSGKDTGRCMIGDIDPDIKGLEVWSMNLRSATGNLLSNSYPGTNANIKWDTDMSTQIVNGALDVTPTIYDYQDGVVLTADGTYTNNGTKGNPCLVADILGDWREELVVRTKDSNSVRIYTNTELTNHKMYTLMHDAQYRTGIAWQNNCYNQPAYTSFYFATDMNFENVPLLTDTKFK